jgi:hypothetical protein
MDSTGRLKEDTKKLKKQMEETQAGFVMTEVSTSMTFARLALDAKDAEKRERNRKNARKGYDTAKRFSGTRALNGSTLREFNMELAKLEKMLRELGEDV